jgi:DNA polymerase III alpha subunit
LHGHNYQKTIPWMKSSRASAHWMALGRSPPLAILGAGLEPHSLELVREKITAAISSIDAAEKIGRRATVAGVRQTSHRSRAAKGYMLMFLTMEDLQGTLDVILFPDVHRVARSMLASNTPLPISDVMEMDADCGEPYLRAEKVEIMG